MEKRVFSLDLLRSAAIVLIMMLHSLEFMSGLSLNIITVFSYGWIGVDLFFVLSGFLIGKQVFNKQGAFPIRNFLTKRFFRTLPLYYVVLIIYLYLKPKLGFPFHDTKWRYFFFLQNFYSPRDFVQSWSLCIEEQFYILFPLVFFSSNFKKIPSYFWLAIGFGSTLLRLYFYKNGIPADSPSLASYNYRFISFTHLDGISWGLFLASTFKTWSTYKNKIVWLTLGLLTLIISLNYIGPLGIKAPIVMSYQLLALSFSCILVGLYDFKNYFMKGIIEKLATWSYGIYLWNNLVARIVGNVFLNQGNLTKFLLFSCITLLVSAVTYTIIETPSLKVRNHFLKKLELRSEAAGMN
jgi:peptidoglycan/LPS O-acetylase OafA/YrhL